MIVCGSYHLEDTSIFIKTQDARQGETILTIDHSGPLQLLFVLSDGQLDQLHEAIVARLTKLAARKARAAMNEAQDAEDVA